MDEGGKFDMPTTSVPTFYSLENKDNTQVVYIYSTSSEIKHEPAEQHQLRSHDELYNTNTYLNEPPLSEDNRANLTQRRDPEASRASQCEPEIESENIVTRGDQFSEYARSRERERNSDYGDMPEGYRRQRSPAEAQKSRYECKKQTMQRINPGSSENFSKSRSFLPRDKNEEGRVMYVEGSYPYDFVPEKRKRDYQNVEEDERNGRLKGDNGSFRYEENVKSGRKSFTPIKIYPSAKDCYRERPRYYRKNEYMYAEPPPNVTLVSQDYRALHEDKEPDERHFEDEHFEKETKMRNFTRVKSEDGRDGNSILPRMQRPEIGEFRGRFFQDKYQHERYDAERLHSGMKKEKTYYLDKDIPHNKSIVKQPDHSSDFSERKYAPQSEIVGRISPPTGYPRFAHRDKPSRFECEMPADKEASYRFIECFGGHEYDAPRKCERYGEMMHEMELHRGKGHRMEKRPINMLPQGNDDKMVTEQKGYMMPAYQRCCCPCCPCYSVFRQSQRDRSPVSPRCSPQKPAVSPKLASRPPSHTENESSKSRPASLVQQMPAELQLKMVARGLPHLRRRRNRTVYTHDQIEELEEVFKIKHYLDVDEKGSIAKRLGIRTENVEIWFKNRRAKWRKEMKTVKSNSDGEIYQYLDEDESNMGEDSESFRRKPLSSILSKDVAEERPTMTLYHTGQETHDDEVDSTVVVAAAN